jgi:N-hydroxyarylamine O-acetyltransferase
MSAVPAYLSRLGIDVPPPPTLDTLFLLHHRHLERVPYENLDIMLGRPQSVDAVASLERIGEVGRAGYCFHHNGSLEVVLLDLGFDVRRRHGHVWTDEPDRGGTFLNHLALHVGGLPTVANPGGEWWVDVGLGDAFRDPLPLMAGTHRQDGFSYVVDEVRPDGWSFHHDAAGSFTGVEVTTLPTDPADVLGSHAELSAPGTGRFSRILVVQRRYAGGMATLRGCLLTRVGGGSTTETELATWETWRAALDDMHLPLADIDEDELRALHAGMWDAHLAYRAS